MSKNPDGKEHVAGKLKLGGVDLGMCQACARASGLVASRGNLYRIYPTPEQEQQLYYLERTCRFVYNMRVKENEWLLAEWDEERRRLWRETRVRLGFPAEGKLTEKQYKAVKKEVPAQDPPPKGWRKQRTTSYKKGGPDIVTTVMSEGKWMERMPDMSGAVAAILRDALSNFDTADKNWSAGRARRPKWKKASDPIGIPVASTEEAATSQVKADRGIRVPKVGWIKAEFHRPWRGTPRNITVTRNGAGQWFASVMSEWQRKPATHRKPGIVGIDPGVVIGACTSDPELPSLPRVDKDPRVVALREKHERLQSARDRRLYRAWQRANPGKTPTSKALARDGVFSSKNYKKMQRRLAKLRLKEQRIRDDAQRKWAQHVASQYEVVAFEDSKVKNMTKRKVGAGKAGRAANQAHLSQGWYGLSLKLEQKLAAYGGQLIRVPAPYTSQQCSACGSLSGTVRETQAKFTCRDCGFTGNADRNAATNICYIAAAKIKNSDERVSAAAQSAVARMEIPEGFQDITRAQAIAERRKANRQTNRPQEKRKTKQKRGVTSPAPTTKNQ